VFRDCENRGRNFSSRVQFVAEPSICGNLGGGRQENDVRVSYQGAPAGRQYDEADWRPIVDVRTMLASAAAGDQAAWDVLVDRYSSLLWSIARSFRLGSADAADAVQLTWLKLVENLDRIQDPDRLAGWLATTVRRECLQLIRRNARTRPLPDAELPEVADTAPPVDDRLLRRERDAELWHTFAQLSERCQRLLRVLTAVPAPAYTEVAAALDMPIGSIGPTRQRCLSRLRELVDAAPVSGAGEGEPS
jgi:RNA polymerase sigma factor (sigma-70 family)